MGKRSGSEALTRRQSGVASTSLKRTVRDPVAEDRKDSALYRHLRRAYRQVIL